MSKRFPKRRRNAETPEELINPPKFPPEIEMHFTKEVMPVLIGIAAIGLFFLALGIVGAIFIAK